MWSRPSERNQIDFATSRDFPLGAPILEKVAGSLRQSFISCFSRYTYINMTSNVLPFFWHLASSSKDTRLSASADLVSSLESFQSTFVENKPETNGDEDEVDEEDESDEESGEEVDASDEENNEVDMEEARRLDKKLGSSNAEDVVYSVKRLVRGLASSRESSRLGFAVALTEVSDQC